MNIKLLSEHHLEFLSLKGCCTGSSVSTILLEITCRGSFVLAIKGLNASFLCVSIMHTFSVFSMKDLLQNMGDNFTADEVCKFLITSSYGEI